MSANPVFGASVTSLEAAGQMGRSMAHDVEEGAAPLHFDGGHHSTRMVPGQFTAEETTDPRPVHPSALKLFHSCDGKVGWIRHIPIFGPAIECYGPRFIVTLDSTYFLSKGIAYGLVGIAVNPLFLLRYNCTALEYQRYYTVSRMGWSIKPFTALLSDAFAFFGYKKRWILTLSAVFGGACSIAMGVLPATHASAIPGAVFAFLVGYGQANIDILSEGLYSRKMRRWPTGGPSLVSSVWVMVMSAGIISSIIQGPVTDAGLPQVGMYVCGACMVLCIPFFLFNGMEEELNSVERRADAVVMRELALEEAEQRRREAMESTTGVSSVSTSRVNGLSFTALDGTEGDEQLKDNLPYANEADHEDLPGSDADEELYIPTYCGGAVEFNKEVLVRNWRITVYSIVMTIVVVVTAIITLLYGTYPLLATSIAGTLILNGMMFWSLPLVVAKAGLFGFINQAFYVNINGPLQSFYISDEKCNPGGPHFSYFFYNTVTGIIGYVAGTLGVIGFAYIFSKRSYRVTFVITIFAEIVGSVFDLIMVKRWNVPAIPDHYMYVFGDAVVYQVAYMLAWMPYCVLLAQLCPRGSEAMVYALLAALTNYGQTIAGEIGTLLMEWVWAVPADLDTGVCNFDNLWKLIVFGHMGLPVGIMICVFLFVPAARVCDELDAETGKSVEKPEHRSQMVAPQEQSLREDDAEGSTGFEPIPVAVTSVTEE